MKKKRINFLKLTEIFAALAFCIVLFWRYVGPIGGGSALHVKSFNFFYTYIDYFKFVFIILFSLTMVSFIIKLFMPTVVKNNSGIALIVKRQESNDTSVLKPGEEMCDVDGVILNGSLYRIYQNSYVTINKKEKIVADSLAEKVLYGIYSKPMKYPINDSWNAIFKYCQSINVDFSTQSKRIAPKSEIRYFFSFPVFYEICLIGFTSIYIFEYAPFFSSNEFLSKLNEFIFDDLMPVPLIIFIATLICGPFYGALSSKVENKTSETIKVKCYGRSDYFELEPGYEMSDVEGVKVNGKVYKIICGPKVIVTKKGSVVVISLLFILFYLFGCFRKKKSPNENWDALFNA